MAKLAAEKTDAAKRDGRDSARLAAVAKLDALKPDERSLKAAAVAVGGPLRASDGIPPGWTPKPAQK